MIKELVEKFREEPSSSLIWEAVSRHPAIDKYTVNRTVAIAEITELITREIIGELSAKKKDFALRYNHGKPQWSLVHFASLEPMVRVLEFGMKKYSRDNWKKGFDEAKLLESMQRHMVAMFSGQLNDEESGLPHVAHLMCNCMFMSYHQLNRKTDGAKTDEVRDDAGGGS